MLSVHTHYGSPVATFPLAQGGNSNPQFRGEDLLSAIAFIQQFDGVDFKTPRCNVCDWF